MKRISLFLCIITFLVNTGVAAGTAAPLSTPELKQIIGSGKKNTVVFFLNPQGGPCRGQDVILQKLLKDRKSGFNIAYVSSLEPKNEKAFYDYGIRSLPSLVIVDAAGKIAKFFPPGIQTYEALAAALDGIK